MITITTAEQLQAISNDMAGEYELGCDIDLAGINWKPLGVSETQTDYSPTQFSGTFNGNGHTIKNLTIEKTTNDTYNLVGLFGRISGTIQNLVIKDANITVYGSNPCVGVLCGAIYDSTPIISKVSVSGNINVTHTYNSSQYSAVGVGGFIGSAMNHISDETQITDCISNVNISITGNDRRSLYVAGFLGYGEEVILTRCFAFGSITVLNTTDTALSISGFQAQCYYTNHNNCATAVNIYNATSDTCSQCCKYLCSTSNFKSNSARKYWLNMSISWESYSSSSDSSFVETDIASIIGADYTSNYQLDDLDFANGKYLKLDIETEDTSVAYDITIGNTTYYGVKRVICNGNELNKLVVGTNEYVFGS